MPWKPLPDDIPLDHEALQPPGGVAGLRTPGNIDIHNRPVARNDDGSISTVLSASFGTPQGEVLVPRVVDGRVVSEKEAFAHYQKTGEHLGIFDSPEDATSYAQSLHNEQAQEYGNGDGNLTPLPEGAQLDPVPPEGAGFTDDQKQQILGYLPKAKDAADLERFSLEISGGHSRVGNAQDVLDNFAKGHKDFGWGAPTERKAEPAAEPSFVDKARDVIGEGILNGLDTFTPGTGTLLRNNKEAGAAFTEHVANGIVGDYGPEVSGFLQTIVDPSGYGEFGKNLDRNVAHTRAQLEGDSQGHEIASGLGEVTGIGLGAALGGEIADAAGAGRLAESAGKYGKPIINAVKASTGGAIVGSGAAGPGDRVEGGVIGAVAAPVVGLAARGAAGLYAGGKSVLQGSPGLARRIIAKAIKDDLNTPASVGTDIAAAHANDVPMALADTGENARGLLAAASRSSGVARTVARDALEERQAGLADRVTDAIERDLGPVANPHEVADTLMTKARDDAKPLYARAYAALVPDAFVEKIKPLLQRPSVQKALGNARRIAQEEGDDPDAIGLAIGSDGQTIIGAAPSWKTLDYIKRGMDDVVEGYRDSTTGKLVLNTEGRAVNNTLRSLIGAIDAQNPVYGAARAAYGGPISGISAMNSGRKFLSMTADDIEARMRDMTPFEKSMAALGTRRAMAELVASKGDSADVVRALTGTGKKRAMLARLFGDRKQFQRFVDTLGQEREGFRTFKQALTGSPTAPNLADDAALQTAATATDLMLAGGLPVATATSKAIKFLGVKLGEKAKQQIAAMLSDTNPARIRELAAELRAEANKRGIKLRTFSRTVGNSAVALQPQRQ